MIQNKKKRRKSYNIRVLSHFQHWLEYFIFWIRHQLADQTQLHTPAYICRLLLCYKSMNAIEGTHCYRNTFIYHKPVMNSSFRSVCYPHGGQMTETGTDGCKRKISTISMFTVCYCICIQRQASILFYSFSFFFMWVPNLTFTCFSQVANNSFFSVFLFISYHINKLNIPSTHLMYFPQSTIYPVSIIYPSASKILYLSVLVSVIMLCLSILLPFLLLSYLCLCFLLCNLLLSVNWMLHTNGNKKNCNQSWSND